MTDKAECDIDDIRYWQYPKAMICFLRTQTVCCSNQACKASFLMPVRLIPWPAIRNKPMHLGNLKFKVGYHYRISITSKEQPGCFNSWSVKAGKADLISRWLDNNHFNHVTIHQPPAEKIGLLSRIRQYLSTLKLSGDQEWTIDLVNIPFIGL